MSRSCDTVASISQEKYDELITRTGIKKMKAHFDSMGNRVLTKLERQLVKAGIEPEEPNQRNEEDSDGQTPEDY